MPFDLGLKIQWKPTWMHGWIWIYKYINAKYECKYSSIFERLTTHFKSIANRLFDAFIIVIPYTYWFCCLSFHVFFLECFQFLSFSFPFTFINIDWPSNFMCTTFSKHNEKKKKLSTQKEYLMVVESEITDRHDHNMMTIMKQLKINFGWMRIARREQKKNRLRLYWLIPIPVVWCMIVGGSIFEIRTEYFRVFKENLFLIFGVTESRSLSFDIYLCRSGDRERKRVA